jgi:alpha-L-rhamnosidase
VYTGDRKVLETAYPHMKNLAIVTDQEYPSGLVTDGFGDWCPPGGNNAETRPVPALTTTATFFHSVQCLVRTAAVLGKDEDIHRFSDIAHKVREAFNEEFFLNTSYGTQGGDGIALYYGLVPGNEREQVESDLAEKIHEHDDHLMTGILTHFPVLWSLTRSGNAGLALKVLTQKTYPSFLRMHEIGATTLLECFDDPDEEGYLSPASHNHPMQGGYDAWLYGAVGGITPDPENPGFRNTIFRLWCALYLESGKASVETEHGTVSSRWIQKGGKVTWNIEIPDDCTGEIRFPEKGSEKIDMELTPAENGWQTGKVESGRYSFNYVC